MIVIWNAKKAWDAISPLKKKPKLAYRLMKYEKKVAREIEVCDKERRRILYDVSGVEPGKPVKLEVGSPELIKFTELFGEFLFQADSDLELVGVTMDELIDGLDAEKGNTLSEDTITLLEPFFQQPESLTPDHPAGANKGE